MISCEFAVASLYIPREEVREIRERFVEEPRDLREPIAFSSCAIYLQIRNVIFC